MDKKYWAQIFEILIPKLTKDDQLNISGFALTPCQVVEIFKELGYENEEFDTNGWEQDTWYYLFKEDCPTIVFNYGGYYGDKWLFLNDI